MTDEPNRSGEAELPRDLSESIFLLRKSSSTSTASIKVDFSPLTDRAEPPQSQPRAQPAFNSDGCYYTPSFILEIDQVRF